MPKKLVTLPGKADLGFSLAMDWGPPQKSQYSVLLCYIDNFSNSYSQNSCKKIQNVSIKIVSK